MGSGMTDYQRISLDLAGLFLFVAGFILAIHFRSYGLIAAFCFFGAAGFFSSLLVLAFARHGADFASSCALFACMVAAGAAAVSFVALFVQAVA